MLMMVRMVMMGNGEDGDDGADGDDGDDGDDYGDDGDDDGRIAALGAHLCRSRERRQSMRKQANRQGKAATKHTNI